MSDGRPGYGRTVAGVLLVVVGVAWLLGASGVVDLPLRALAPIALVVIGAALIAGARTGPHTGLIVLGAILTLVIAAGSVVFPVEPRFRVFDDHDVVHEGVGERLVRPTGDDELAGVYRLDTGRLTLDLRSLSLRSRRAVRARVGAGRLEVLLPRGMRTAGRAQAGVGSIDAVDVSDSGIQIDLDFATFRDGSPRLRLELSIGVGRIDVRVDEDVQAPRSPRQRRPRGTPPPIPGPPRLPSDAIA